MSAAVNIYADFTAETDAFSVEADVEDDVDEKWQKLAEHLLGEKQSEREKILECFKEAIAKDELLKHSTDERLGDDGFLTRFLRAGCWRVEAALPILKTYSSLGQEYECYVSRAIPTRLDCVYNAKINAMSDMRDKYGRRIYIFRLGQWDPDKVMLEDFYASAYIFFEMIAREVKTQIAGVTVINDVTGFGFKHLRHCGLEQMRAIITFMNGGFPLWFRKIHVVNQPRLFGVLFNMIKPFLDERIKENIMFHGSNHATLHAEVSSSILPRDLGGSSKELDNSASVEAAKNLDQYFKDHVEKSLSRISRNSEKNNNK